MANEPPLILFLLLGSLSQVSSINLVPSLAQIHTSVNRGTWFGYAVGLYKNGNISKLIVGAPKDSSAVIRRGTQYRNGGVVMGCTTDLRRKTTCTEIEFDIEGQPIVLTRNTGFPPKKGRIVGDKTNQHFGATISISKTGDSVMACAPRYSHIFYAGAPEPVGRCILAQNSLQNMTVLEVFKYLKVAQRGYTHNYQISRHLLGVAMIGTSAAIPEGQESVFMGGPGAWYWQGTTVKMSTINLGSVKNTTSGSSKVDWQMQGYSMAAGDFKGTGIDGVASGMPGSNNNTGLVGLYDSDLNRIHDLYGDQLGSKFGFSVAASDFDGDGVDDVVVGAPYFSTSLRLLNGMMPNGPAYRDVGKVHIFYSRHTFSSQQSTELLGPAANALFGYSVAAAGDLDGDGYKDIVVGAPDYGPGAIYVYHGSATGMIPNPAQVIRARDLNDQRLTRFGFSLDGGKDIDDNLYPDLAVGAYASDQAVLIRTRPVIRLNGNFKEDLQSHQISGVIDVNEKNCPHNGRNLTCRHIELCLGYEEKNNSLYKSFDVKLELDSLKSKPERRVLFVMSNAAQGQNVLTTPLWGMNRQNGKPYCSPIEFHLIENIMDKVTPIRITVSASFSPGANQLSPMLDTSKSSLTPIEFAISTACLGGKNCFPDLQLSAICHSALTIGANELLTIHVTVINVGASAPDPQLFLYLPSGIDYVSFKNIGNGTLICTPHQYLPDLVVCNLPNPIKTNDSSEFEIQLETSNFNTNRATVELRLWVNNTNPEDNTRGDNEQIISLAVSLDLNIQINGNSNPGNVMFPSAANRKNIAYLSDAGPLVTHTYEVANLGATDFGRVEVKIFWPSFTHLTNSTLLYLFQHPNIPSQIFGTHCTVVQAGHINHQNLKAKSGVVLPSSSSASSQSTNVANPNPSAALSFSIAQKFRNLVNQLRTSTNISTIAKNIASLNLNCSDMACTEIRCDIPRLPSKGRVTIEIPSRIWINTLVDEAWLNSSISSVAIAEVISVPYSILNPSLPAAGAIVSTSVEPTGLGVVVSRGIPPWLIFVAALLGLLLLLLLILLLWALGFFKRRRPDYQQATMVKAPGAGMAETTTSGTTFPSGYRRYTSTYSAKTTYTLPKPQTQSI